MIIPKVTPFIDFCKEYLQEMLFVFLNRSGIIAFLDRTFFSAVTTARSKHGGSPVLSPNEVDPSYILLSTFNTGDLQTNGGQVHLTDVYGATLHSWHTQYQTSVTHLFKNGDLMVSQLTPGKPETSHFPGGGRTGILQKLSWDSRVLWEYKNDAMHHDFEVLPNGNVIVTIWERVPEHIVTQVAEAGREVWADVLIEVNTKGEIVWEWHAFDHLNPSGSLLNEFTHRVEWTHTNSVSYIPSDPFNNDEALLISMRNANAVHLISKKTKKILWSSPKGMVAGQHDASFLKNGRVLVFDNGLHRRPTSRSEVVKSRVLEIDPLTNEIAWELTGGSTSSESASLYSSIMCGAERLENGNTLVVLSSPGHLFEVTPEKKVVWDFINPVTTAGSGLFPNNALFTARRYRSESLSLPVHLPPPIPAKPPYTLIYKNRKLHRS